MFAQIQALNLSNTFSKIINLGKQIFFFFKLLGHAMKASSNFFFFWIGPRFRPKSWHGWRGPRVPDGLGLGLRKKLV